MPAPTPQDTAPASTPRVEKGKGSVSPPGAAPVAPPSALKKAKAPTISLLVRDGVRLREPHSLQWFIAGEVTEVPEITTWIQAQIDAQMMCIVDPPPDMS